MQKNYFLKTDSQLGKPRRDSTSEEISKDNPPLASQNLLSNPNNGITMPHTPKTNDDDIQHLIRKIERSPSTAWSTNLATRKRLILIRKLKFNTMVLKITKFKWTLMQIYTKQNKQKKPYTFVSELRKLRQTKSQT
ncbi:hypothetical protein AVEN_126122-1 [Araneus ventricosus]|uniref:Uncharacterized protein n=1 Tax=Araneus ventricosus TaxID=182803 RepID=A0A4Y2M4N8_ARAVE|nr:hypothetical protein AVEN_126122-1 [Araneus ventricosus]